MSEPTRDTTGRYSIWYIQIQIQIHVITHVLFVVLCVSFDDVPIWNVVVLVLTIHVAGSHVWSINDKIKPHTRYTYSHENEKEQICRFRWTVELSEVVRAQVANSNRMKIENNRLVGRLCLRGCVCVCFDSIPRVKWIPSLRNRSVRIFCSVERFPMTFDRQSAVDGSMYAILSLNLVKCNFWFCLRFSRSKRAID